MLRCDGQGPSMTPLIGVFDLFRIGLGPSSSHTVGPMRAAAAFVAHAAPYASSAARVEVTLFGSLAWTGRGHGTDAAVLAGLAGMQPATADPDRVRGLPAPSNSRNRSVLG
jgi:L-serine dehydratase